MPDLKRVIYDIERCICHVPDACKDCSKYGGDNAIRCMEELLTDALELLKSQEPKWISVKDRLPETRHAVLVYTPYHKNIWAASMHEDGNWYIWSPGSRVLLDPDWHGPITHWMALPESPKEET